MSFEDVMSKTTIIHGGCKCFVFLLFVGSMLMAGTSTAESESTCSVDTVPIQVMGWAGDPERREGYVSALSATKISRSYPNFRAFLMTVTEHIATRLENENLCLNNAESREQSLLQFMHWDIYSGNNPPAPVTSLDVRPSNGCRISSPWIDLAIERKPVPWIRAIVRWNDRQFLADQAVLAGAQNVPSGVAVPLTNNEFRHFVIEYERTEVHGEPMAQPVEERIPPDLLWLFRRFPYWGEWELSKPVPFGLIRSTIYAVTQRGEKGHTKIVTALIDRCFASDGGADFKYSSILDAAVLVSLEQYKIDMPPIR